MYRITIDCFDIRDEDGPEAAADIESEFREHRTWFTDPSCLYESGKLTLSATNDVDSDGLALLDEFGDCLEAYLGEHGEVRVRQVEAISAH